MNKTKMNDWFLKVYASNKLSINKHSIETTIKKN